MLQVQLEGTSEARLELLLLLHNSTTKTQGREIYMWSNLPQEVWSCFTMGFFSVLFFIVGGENTHLVLDLPFTHVECKTIN